MLRRRNQGIYWNIDRLEKTEYKADVNDMEVEQLTGYNNAIVFFMTLINHKYEFTFD